VWSHTSAAGALDGAGRGGCSRVEARAGLDDSRELILSYAGLEAKEVWGCGDAEGEEGRQANKKSWTE